MSSVRGTHTQTRGLTTSVLESCRECLMKADAVTGESCMVVRLVILIISRAVYWYRAALHIAAPVDISTHTPTYAYTVWGVLYTIVCVFIYSIVYIYIFIM